MLLCIHLSGWGGPSKLKTLQAAFEAHFRLFQFHFRPSSPPLKPSTLLSGPSSLFQAPDTSGGLLRLFKTSQDGHIDRIIFIQMDRPDSFHFRASGKKVYNHWKVLENLSHLGFSLDLLPIISLFQAMGQKAIPCCK